MNLTSIHSYFCEHSPFATILLLELANLIMCSWFLATKLVARESKNLKALTAVLVVKLLHLLIVIFSQTALRSNIYDDSALLACNIS